MSVYPKSIAIALLVLIGAICGQSSALDRTNFMRNGVAEVRLNIEDNGNIPDSLEASIITLSLFDRPFESMTVKMNRIGNSFALSVPLYTNEAIAGIEIESPEQRFAVGMIEISQNSPLIIDGYFDPNGVLILSKSNDTDVNKYELGPTPENKSIDIANIIYRFVSYRIGLDEREPSIQSDDYNDWKSVKVKLDSLYEVQLEYALNGRTIPEAVNDWLINSLKYFYAANWRFNYKERAERTFNVKGVVDAPPLEYYAFLNDIDFSSILNHSTIFGPYYLLDKMITQLPIEIKPIGETPVDTWEKEIKDKLTAIMPDPEPILMDLLAMTSYLQQIKEYNRPLNNIQINNIKDGFNADISSIILDINSSMISDLDPNTIIADYIGKQFSLDEFLKEYPGTPVIVDLWNTWCAPCIEAHKKMKSVFNAGSGSDGILRLYICDESSPLNEWERLAPHIGGVQIRLSSKDMERILTRFELTAFPSYLFFNNKHELVNKQTGFSDIDQFTKIVDQLINQ